MKLMKNEQINIKVTDLEEQSLIEAIAHHFETETDNVEKLDCDHYGLEVYKVDGEEYAIGDDSEAQKAAREYIENTAWAFNANFLADMTDLPIEVFEALQDKCEGSNKAVVRMIETTCGMDDFVDAAISADGRGHFLSGYDGNEVEFMWNEVRLFAYKN